MSLNIPSTTSDQSASSVVQAAQQLSTAVTDQNLCSVQKPASIPMYLLNAHSWSDAGRMKTCDRYFPNLLDLCMLCNDSPSYTISRQGSFLFIKRDVCELESVAGSVIRASVRLSFEDDLKSGGLLKCAAQLGTLV